ncbi:TPA_asm: hypothetical protein vir524_00012 [Caudoviricetes sp. vir524]|jgi:hypothetical protein|nr:TPA_asm: hypothetical protein vir524_00012 [Caudoviricetes sp. vir524]
MKTLFDFSRPDPAREESVPLGPVPIRNFPLVVITVEEAFAKDPERTALLLDSNGTEDKPATEWQLRRVVN